MLPRMVQIVIPLLIMCAPIAARVTVRDNVDDEGQKCFKVTTQAATYWYQKQACGFSSIEDPQGNDWVGYDDDFPNSARGGYRGIPNLGWQFHPGYTKGGSTTLERSGDEQATLRSEANGWVCTWDFYDTHAVMTLLEAKDEYWFLYEGTPGGRMEPSQDYYYVPDRSATDGVARSTAKNDYGRDLPGEWIAFGDPNLSRMFVLAHHTDDNLIDDYYDMGGEGGMTVFGFGRDNDKTRGCWSCMSGTPRTFSLGFVESTARTAVRAFAESLLAGEPPVATVRYGAGGVTTGETMAQPNGLPTTLFDLVGRTVYRGSARAGGQRPCVPGAQPGVYLLREDGADAVRLLRAPAR